RMLMAVRGMTLAAGLGAGGCAAFAVDPTGVAVFVVLLFPDGHTMFDFVDDVAARAEGCVAVSGAGADPYGHFSDGEVANAMYARGAFDAEALDGLGHDSLAFLYCERFECLVFEVSDAHAFVVIADEAFE